MFKGSEHRAQGSGGQGSGLDDPMSEHTDMGRAANFQGSRLRRNFRTFQGVFVSETDVIDVKRRHDTSSLFQDA
jgi:hypothetical protein